MTEIQELREIVQAQAERIETLVRLVERMGRDVVALEGKLIKRGLIGPIFPYTIIGQRHHDAAMHEAEGPPPTREDMGL